MFSKIENVKNTINLDDVKSNIKDTIKFDNIQDSMKLDNTDTSSFLTNIYTFLSNNIKYILIVIVIALLIFILLYSNINTIIKDIENFFLKLFKVDNNNDCLIS